MQLTVADPLSGPSAPARPSCSGGRCINQIRGHRIRKPRKTTVMPNQSMQRMFSVDGAPIDPATRKRHSANHAGVLAALRVPVVEGRTFDRTRSDRLASGRMVSARFAKQSAARQSHRNQVKRGQNASAWMTVLGSRRRRTWMRAGSIKADALCRISQFGVAGRPGGLLVRCRR